MKPVGRLSELTEDWSCFARRKSLKSSLRLILSDMARLPIRHLKFVLLSRSLLEPFPDWESKTQLMILPFEPIDTDWVRQVNRPSEARLCAQRLAQGDKGLMAFCAGAPAGYTWGSADTYTRLERVHPRLDQGDFLCTDSYTCPKFRGLGIQTALTQARFQLFREMGFCRAISYIEIHNQPSLAVWQKKFNSQTIGMIDFLRIGPWYRVRYT
jgi:GNAT superfamily N-acetyltransferase